MGPDEEKERQLHRDDMADLYIATAERYEHSAIFLHPEPWHARRRSCRLIDLVREKSGDQYFLMLHGDATFGIPNGDHMVEFAVRMVRRAAEAEGARPQARWSRPLRRRRALTGARRPGRLRPLRGLLLQHRPVPVPGQFAEFVTPYLARLIQGYRELGFYVIKHTDGNIMPILDQLVQANPHALHSLDPQGGVDIAEVKRRYGDRVCLIGNVNCGLLDTGTDEECVASARYCLQHGMPGGGYIFSTSNCVYTGMRLARYELIQGVAEGGELPGVRRGYAGTGSLCVARCVAEQSVPVPTFCSLTGRPYLSTRTTTSPNRP